MGKAEVMVLTKSDIEAIVNQTVGALGLAKNTEDLPRGNRSHIPATLAVSDIMSYYGVARNKWVRGVKDGIFPQPISGFVRPKRWRRSDVEAALGLGETQ